MLMIASIECFMLLNFLCNLNFKTKKMKKKITLLIASALFAIGRLASQSSCSDLNGYVNFKNVGATGSCLTFNRRNPGGFKKLGL